MDPGVVPNLYSILMRSRARDFHRLSKSSPSSPSPPPSSSGLPPPPLPPDPYVEGPLCPGGSCVATDHTR